MWASAVGHRVVSRHKTANPGAGREPSNGIRGEVFYLEVVIEHVVSAAKACRGLSASPC